MVELRIRNLLCFSELQAYNDTGKFLNQHPLIVHRSERNRLEDLLRSSTDAFLREYANCERSIKRYKGYLKGELTPQKRAAYKKHLKHYTELATLFKTLLDDNKR